MTKRLCKYNRNDIVDNLGTIHHLVIEPKFLCRSCARSSSSKESLCKPTAIPPKECQNKPAIEKKRCALLEESLLPESASSIELEGSVVSAQKSVSKAALKKAKKSLKKQKKYQKKLQSILKKQKQLIKKQHAIEQQFANLTLQEASVGEFSVDNTQVH